jgi:hypothetical protein
MDRLLECHENEILFQLAYCGITAAIFFVVLPSELWVITAAQTAPPFMSDISNSAVSLLAVIMQVCLTACLIILGILFILHLIGFHIKDEGAKSHKGEDLSPHHSLQSLG